MMARQRRKTGLMAVTASNRKQRDRAQLQRAQSQGVQLQQLESRTHMTAVQPLAVATISTQLGTELKITGTAGSDIIKLVQTPATLVLTTGTGWRDTFAGNYCEVCINGGAGNNVINIDKSVKDNLLLIGGGRSDTITDAGSGTDSLYGGSGANRLVAGGGNDTIVAVGGTSATVEGGSGLDSFWINSTGDTLTGVTTADTNAGAVHEISTFMPLRVQVNGVWTTTTVSKQLLGQTFTEPTLAQYADGYANFSSDPLFSSAGPLEDDIQQGGIGDCYFLATLAALAKNNPELIRQSIVSLGDGTFAVQFFNSGGVKTYVRLDGELPTTSWGGQAYDAVGTQSDIWAALMEKAWTYYRDDEGSYESINAGLMSDAFTALGLKSQSIYSASSATSLAQQLQSLLAAGDSVTFATNVDTGNLIGGHAYTVDHVTTDSNGNVTGIVLRNPWGIAGAGSNPDGSPYVTVTPAVAFGDFSFETSASSSWPITVAEIIKKAKVAKKAA
jgi:hypothetical protein